MPFTGIVGSGNKSCQVEVNDRRAINSHHKHRIDLRKGGSPMLQGIFGGLASWGPDFIRLGVAFTFILHGYPKLFGPKPGPKGFAGYLGSMGFPSPLFFAYAAGITEFVGGVCILLGFLTRFWALVGAIEFLTRILT